MTCVHCKSSQNEMHNEYVCIECYLDFLVYESESVMALYKPSIQKIVAYQLDYDCTERAMAILLQLESQKNYLNKDFLCKCSNTVTLEKSILVGYQNEIHAFCDSDCYFKWRESIEGKGVDR